MILLDHRVHDQVSTRRLRVVKYRGSHHGTNEYPFLIDSTGISVLPVSSMALEHTASLDRISTGIPQLDAMLGDKGYYRGSTVLVTGGAGTGKTSLAAHFLDAACRRGERCLCFLFEESPQQLLRNMRSIGIDLEPWVAAGLLKFHADRPSRYGLETHLAKMHQLVADFKPTVTVIDPVTNLMTVGTYADVQAMLTRMIDHLKTENITAVLTSLTPGMTEHRADREHDLVADGYVDRDGERRRQQPPSPRAVRAEVPRHGALERAARVQVDGSRTGHSRRRRQAAGRTASPCRLSEDHSATPCHRPRTRPTGCGSTSRDRRRSRSWPLPT